VFPFLEETLRTGARHARSVRFEVLVLSHSVEKPKMGSLPNPLGRPAAGRTKNRRTWKRQAGRANALVSDHQDRLDSRKSVGSVAIVVADTTLVSSRCFLPWVAPGSAQVRGTTTLVRLRFLDDDLNRHPIRTSGSSGLVWESYPLIGECSAGIGASDRSLSPWLQLLDRVD
jgi:hypothetical protein